MSGIQEWVPLTEVQEKAIHHAACQIVAAAVTGRPLRLSDPRLAGLADERVMGVFVTLKQNGQLRGCIGSLADYDVRTVSGRVEICGEPLPLLKALKESGRRTALEDYRFSPVRESELPALTLDVSMLFHFEQVTVAPEQREQAVVVGKHGIRIHCRGKSAIFLPVVPIEQRWNVRTCLEQLCRKAGLPIEAWRDPEAVLVRFEGRMIEGPFEADLLIQKGGAPGPSRATSPPARWLADFAVRNIRAMVQGGIPATFPPGLPEGECSGLALAVSVGNNQRAVFASIQPTGRLPLQMTLLSLCQSASGTLQQSRIPAGALSGLRADVLVMGKPVSGGTISEPRINDVDPARQSIVITEPGRMAWSFDSSASPEAVYRSALRHGEFSGESRASVLIADTDCSAEALWGASRSRGSTADVRPPAVAGTFYPGQATKLNQVIEECLKGPSVPADFWPAAMVPHAGLVYSGRIAGQTLKHLKFPSTAIILSPRHSRSGADWALAPHTHWQIPGATLAADPDWTRRLSQSIDGLTLDAAAHAREHGIEVELPFIARLAPQVRIVGLTIGAGSLEQCLRFGRQLGALIREAEEKPLLLISSDMNHFASDVENRRLDEMALTAMESGDPSLLYRTVFDNRISMCGVLPAVIAMEALRSSCGLNRLIRTGYATSAEVSGDRDRVVGYAGMLLG